MKKTVLFIICLWLFAIQSVQAQLLLNEIYASPPTGEKEWLEIYNPSEVAIALSDWKVAENVNGVIKNHELIDKNGEATLSAKSFWILETSKITLNNSGDTIYLFDQHGTQADFITYPKLTNQQSYGRIPDGSNNWQISEPTMGFTNNLPEETISSNDGQPNSSANLNQASINNQAANNPTSVNSTNHNSVTSADSLVDNVSWKEKINFVLPKYTYREETSTFSGVLSARERSLKSATATAAIVSSSSPLQFINTFGGIAAIIIGLLLIFFVELMPVIKKWYDKKDAVVDF